MSARQIVFWGLILLGAAIPLVAKICGISLFGLPFSAFRFDGTLAFASLMSGVITFVLFLALLRLADYWALIPIGVLVGAVLILNTTSFRIDLPAINIENGVLYGIIAIVGGLLLQLLCRWLNSGPALPPDAE